MGRHGVPKQLVHQSVYQMMRVSRIAAQGPPWYAGTFPVAQRWRGCMIKDGFPCRLSLLCPVNNKRFYFVPFALLLAAVVVAFIVLSLPPRDRKLDVATAAAAELPPSDHSAKTRNSVLLPSTSSSLTTAAAASTARTAPSLPPPASSLPSAADNVAAVPASGGPSATPAGPGRARVSAAAAQRDGVVPDPDRGPAWPTGFVLYRSSAEILAGKDMSDPEQRALAVAEMSEAEEVRYEAVLAKAEQLGIPVRVDGVGNKVSILHDIRGEEPLYRTTQNRDAAISSGANLLYPAPYNLGGAGVKVGVWDAGRVRNTHQEFNTNRVVNRNATAPLDDHATHVAGTVGASGYTASAKGMAPSVAIDSWDWSSDYAEMTSSGAATV